MRKRQKTAEIQKIAYQPSGSHQLDIEVLQVSELRSRIGRIQFGIAHRIGFYQLMCVTAGRCDHTVDFRPFPCTPSTLLNLRPAQAQQFDATHDWEGWLVIFRPEFLLPQQATTVSELRMAVDLDALPQHLYLSVRESETITRSVNQMHEDARLDAPPADIHGLLRHQLYSLLLRLQILHGQRQSVSTPTGVLLKRFQRFQHFLEKNFARWHRVIDYSAAIGCSGKSLNRAVLEATGDTAKAYIAARIILEAKRLLAHTDVPIGLISEQVGFDESTNFIKFFRREVGFSPGRFRRIPSHD